MHNHLGDKGYIIGMVSGFALVLLTIATITVWIPNIQEYQYKKIERDQNRGRERRLNENGPNGKPRMILFRLIVPPIERKLQGRRQYGTA